MQVQAMAARAAHAELTPWSYSIGELGPYACLIRVFACGICHSDVHMIDNDWTISNFPLVPGHEAVGEIVELGSQVRHLEVGDRVGVGWQRSACLTCPECLRGAENLCEDNKGVISDGYGGFADYLVVDSRFAFRIPSGIETSLAGPLLCGGITVYSGLVHAGMTSGKRIGIIGVGGLGHMAVQFASKLGNHVTVFTTSDDKAEFATRLGAHDALVCRDGEIPEPQRKLDILLNTAPANLDWERYLDLLAPDGALHFVGVPAGKLKLPLTPLLTKRLRVMGSPIGGRGEIAKMLEIADTFGIEPVVETFALSEVNEALQRVRENSVRYRAVLFP
ncbi:MAG: NAD(P)-dependent alcohol dehydrogenase [Myxococcales bacterium]|nr:NAD(P)-dependent alcohol dehydrogenase [Myxococcales bacterium]